MKKSHYEIEGYPNKIYPLGNMWMTSFPLKEIPDYWKRVYESRGVDWTTIPRCKLIIKDDINDVVKETIKHFDRLTWELALFKRNCQLIVNRRDQAESIKRISRSIPTQA